MESRRPRILMYHGVCPALRNPNKIFTSPELFEAHMRYLKQHNLRGVSVRKLRRAMEVGDAGNLVGITFDDGYDHLLHTALPVLERFGFSATVSVVAGMLGMKNDWEYRYHPRPRLKLLGVEGVRELSERGMEVASHGMSHTALAGLPPDLLEEEVSESRQYLRELLDEAVDGFFYPYGVVDSAALQAVRKAQYAYACSTITRIERNAYDLPRITVADDGLTKFAVKLKIYRSYAAAKKIYTRYIGYTDLEWPDRT